MIIPKSDYVSQYISSEKHKMISPDGVKANMVCASCKSYNNAMQLCKLYNERVTGGHYCKSYTMERFFQERGYKEIKQSE